MLKNRVALFILLGCISCLQYVAFGQKATAKVSVQPFEILIGQQAVIDLQVIAPKGNNILMPVYDGTLVPGVEILGMSPADTTYAHDVMTISQKYIVTSFDSALYHIPYMPVIDGLDTIQTNDFALKVVSPELTEATLEYIKQWSEQPNDSIDFAQLGINDIKPVLAPPFVLLDYINYILIAILIWFILLIIAAAIYLYFRKKKKGYYFRPVIVKPPHEIALSALNQVKDEKLWQQGREKEYYTELTDILRKYIEDRFYISAPEMTSDEILTVIKGFTDTDSSYYTLEQVLKLSDLVKFAKYKPLTNENDLSLVNAYLFVNQTKREEPVAIEGEEHSDNEAGKVAPSTTDKTLKSNIKDVVEEEKIDWKIRHDEETTNNDSQEKNN